MHLNDLFLTYQDRLVQCAAQPEDGPKITVIGGGTGLSTLLRGLKLYSHHLTAVVSVADNGGSSGILRKDLGILPPGDIRNCILSLADAEPLMTDLMNYRFTDGSLEGQNFGNLFLAALSEICDQNFYEAIRNFSRVLAVTGRVLPVSLTNLNITALLSSGEKVVGESAIGHREDAHARIESLEMVPKNAVVFYESVDAIRDADLVVIGPGSLYTSIIPNLLFQEVVEAIEQSKAKVVYVCNLMTQPSETYQYTAVDHLAAILKHAGKKTCQGFIDYCVVNNAMIPQRFLDRYMDSEAHMVLCNPQQIEDLGATLIQAPLFGIQDHTVRHDHMALSQLITMLAILSIDEQIDKANTRVYRQHSSHK